MRFLKRLKRALRILLDDEPKPARQVAAPRPEPAIRTISCESFEELIDHSAQVCHRCAELEPGICAHCGEAIPEMLWMGTAGYASQSVDHWHDVQIGKVVGKKPVKVALCPDCYDEDWKKVYPSEPIPRHQPRIVYDD